MERPQAKDDGLKPFLSDQVKAAEVGRDLYCQEKQTAGIRYDSLHFAMRLVEANSAQTDPAAIVKNAKVFEKYLQGTDL